MVYEKTIGVYTITVEESQMDTPADTMDSNNNEDISLLTWMIKIQKEIIDQLTSDMIVKEGYYKIYTNP